MAVHGATTRLEEGMRSSKLLRNATGIGLTSVILLVSDAATSAQQKRLIKDIVGAGCSHK